MAALLRGAAMRAAAVPTAARHACPRRCVSSSQRLVRASAAVQSTYSKQERGAPNSLEFRLYTQEKGRDISPWHDIPLYLDSGLVSFVCEIPKETSAKMEVATEEATTPIKQDVKKGKLRFYPYNINWNYGLLPQTWEDPAHKAEDGDNDPVDVVEIGEQQLEMGGVYAVKPLAVLAMIDDGELDWKIVAIRADDPRAASVNDVEDVEREFPGELERIRVWFQDYKIPDGKPANKFGFDNQPQNKEFTLKARVPAQPYPVKVIAETHEFYNSLKSGKRDNSEGLALK